MLSTKQKVSDAAAVAKEHVDILKAKAQEKRERAVGRTKGEKEMAHERRKAKEAEAKMKMHEAKAEHAHEKVHGKHHGLCGCGPGHHSHPEKGILGHHQPAGATLPATGGGAAPTYPLGGHHHTGWADPK